MPPDKNILELTGIQKITNRYQELNKNKVKFQEKISVDVDNEKKTNRKWIS